MTFPINCFKISIALPVTLYIGASLAVDMNTLITLKLSYLNSRSFLSVVSIFYVLNVGGFYLVMSNPSFITILKDCFPIIYRFGMWRWNFLSLNFSRLLLSTTIRLLTTFKFRVNCVFEFIFDNHLKQIIKYILKKT